MKKILNINGKLAFPIQIGNRAVIICGSAYIYTSDVVKIIKKNKYYVQFETINSIYNLSLLVYPNEIKEHMHLRLCA